MVNIQLVSNDAEIEGILRLQSANHAANLTAEQIASQGFVTVKHDFNLLKRMNGPYPSIIAKDGDTVVGYCIVMSPQFQNDVPALGKLFDAFNEITYRGKPLSEYDYLVGGQVCVAEGYRGQQIFDRLHWLYRDVYSPRFDLMATDISVRNQRSLNAHKRVGFEVVHIFTAPDGEEWEVVLWNWKK
jgi:hypothetical protein